MVRYGTTRSTVEPQDVEICETKVFVSSDVHTVETENGIEYEYDLTEYDKDEYLTMTIERNRLLEDSLTNTQLALCDVYELIGG